MEAATTTAAAAQVPSPVPFAPPRFDTDDELGYKYLEDHGYVVFKDVLSHDEVRGFHVILGKVPTCCCCCSNVGAHTSGRGGQEFSVAIFGISWDSFDQRARPLVMGQRYIYNSCPFLPMLFLAPLHQYDTVAQRQQQQ